ncbi:long-chain fatty acid--CoA ligase [Natronorubrum halophilum]|uniref:long-chain fatty acid--CoA ligase n=1 Tax=Natronorubrum halophilum TaxID=1702106 RepID=UPI000EF6DCA9|nr:long-chain fatty acid--CoA ligase [Natronorubrum halophilum]
MVGGADMTIQPFLWRAERLYPSTEIVSRTVEDIERYTYSEYANRVRQLANALDDYGITERDRIGTFCWNDYRHFETYFAVPSIGAQLHTINPQLPDEHIKYIVQNAEDRLLFIGPELVDSVEEVAKSSEFSSVEQYVVMSSELPETELDAVPYEEFIGDQSTTYDWPEVAQDQPAGMCYTSGTTGKPKGVKYTQQMIWAHTMQLQTPQGIPVEDDDVVMPVVPMFHVNAWGLPYAATTAGAKQVFPGPSPDPEDLAHLIEKEEVTLTGGVPTVWLGLIEYCKEHDVDLSALERVIVGGSAAPESMIRWFDEHDIQVIHPWGMTETTPVASVSYLKNDLQNADEGTKMNKYTKQGLILPGLELIVVDENGNEVEWNGEEFGELWVRGPTVTTEYFERPEANEESFEDEWLKTGDIVTVDEDGYIEIVDRVKDVIKSGGEWISSVELENTIMSNDHVREAVVIGVPHEKWQERPVAFIAPINGTDHETIVEEIYDMLHREYPKWWVPDEIEFTDEIPKTATGKFSKKDLREQYAENEK